MDGGVVLRLDRADGHAATAARACRPPVVRHRVATLWGGTNLHRQVLETHPHRAGADAAIAVRGPDRWHRIRDALSIDGVGDAVAAHADLVFRFFVPVLQGRVIDRPVDPDPVLATDPEVVGA